MIFQQHRPGSHGDRRRRWFEPLDGYEPKTDFHAVTADSVPDSWTLRKQSIWTVARPPGNTLAGQGWKIHVSCRTADVHDVLRLCLPVLCAHEVCFRFAADSWVAGELNGRLWPRESAGEFITCYPPDLPSFLALGDELTKTLEPFAGPYILPDRRWPGSNCVFYRYGEFTGHSELTEDGSRRFLIRGPGGEPVEDRRRPYFHLLDGITDPLHPGPEPPAPASYTLADDRYALGGAVSFCNRGGVYQARDRVTGKPVILKEARPRVEIGRARVDAVTVLRKEFDLLSRLNGSNRFVRPLDYFQEWEHSYLVEERVEGDTFAEYVLAHHPIYAGPVQPGTIREYLRRMCTVWLGIARAIESAHRAGIVLGDLSATNVIVGPEEWVSLVDLEGARAEDAPSIGLFTPGFTKPSSWETGESTRANDLYGLGALMFAGLVLASTFTEYHPPARRSFLRELERDLGLPRQLGELIEFLLDERNLDGISIGQVIEKLLELQRLIERVWWPRPRLATPATVRFADGAGGNLRKPVMRMVTGVGDYLRAVADFSRTDRLFPADMMVFATNPVSVAYGAAGVLHALRSAGEAIPPVAVRWMRNAPSGNDVLPPGLYLGKAGLAWVLDELGHPEHARRLLAEAARHPLLGSGADVLHGTAGFGLAALRFWHRWHDPDALRHAEWAGDRLLAGVRRTSGGGVCWAPPDERIVGFARGNSGIALFLLYLGLTTKEEKYLGLGRRALEEDLGHAAWTGTRFLGFPEAPAGAPSPYWEAGTAGVMASLLRYYALAPGQDDLLPLIRKFQVDLGHKYARFPHLFNGAAGMGNALLDLGRLLGEPRHVAQAWQVAEGILLQAIERPEGITFPGARGLRESGDFATGAAGVAAFLARLLAAESDLTSAAAADFNFTLDEYFLDPVRDRPPALAGSAPAG